MENELLKYFLPEELLRYFDVERILQTPIPDTDELQLHIHLREINELPQGYEACEWESKGFYEPKKITDFPIRGKMVYLVIRCRRWRNKADKSKEVRRDFTFLAQGVKMTADLSAFLKQTGQYLS
jgi:hypothetical protein